MPKQPDRPERGQEILPWAQNVDTFMKKGRQAYASQFSNGVAPEPFTTSYRRDNHFTVFAQKPYPASSPLESVSVRGGKWVFPDGTEAPLYNLAVEASAWTDIITVSLSGETAPIRIYVVLDADKTKCRIVKSTTYDDDESTLEYMPIATVPVALGILNGQILQHWRGGYIVTGGTIKQSDLDLLSINLNSLGEVQIYAWETAASIEVLEFGDLFPYKPASGTKEVDYAGIEDIAAYVESVLTAGAYPDELSIDYVADTELQLNNWASATDTVLAYDTDSLIPFKRKNGVNFDDTLQYVSIASIASALAEDIPHTGLDFTGSTAAKGTGLSGGNTDHDDSYWHEYGASFVDTKSFRTSGDLWASGLRVSPDGSSGNQAWTATAFRVDVTSDIDLDAPSMRTDTTATIEFYAGTTLTITGLTGSVFGDDGAHAELKAATYVDLNPTGELRINNTAGWGGTFTNGDGDTVTVTKGIITNVAP